VTSKYGWVGIANYHDQRIVDMADGELFNTITNGKNTMLAYGPNVTVNDRWAIIAYLRALQRSQNATEADVPPEHRAALDKPAEPKAEPKPEAPKK
jgi:mono/diheme cytochrome c family protein